MRNFAILITFIVVSGLGAQEMVLGTPKLDPISQQMEYTGRSGEIRFTLQTAVEPSGVALGKIKDILKEVSSWDEFKLGSLRFALQGNVVNALVVPSQFKVQGQDIASLMPSGMLFELDNYLRFDFRLSVQGVLVRLSGGLFSFEEFRNTLQDVIDNPILFLQRNDPLYLFNQQKRLQESLATTQEQVDSLQKELAQSKERLQTLEKEGSANLSLLRFALSTVGNRDFFGTTYPLSPQEVEKVLELARSSSPLKRREILKSYKASGGKLSDNEVFLVLGVWFNQFVD